MTKVQHTIQPLIYGAPISENLNVSRLILQNFVYAQSIEARC